MVKQISVFLENTRGRLSQMTKVLQEADIDVMALSIADTTNFGILRAVVSDEEKAESVLKKAGYTLNTNDVLAVEVPDRPGGLCHILEVLASNEVGVDYLYSFVRRPSEKALLVFRVDDVEGAAEYLKQNDVNLLSKEDLMDM